MNYRSIIGIFIFVFCLGACSSETDNPHIRPMEKPATMLELNNGVKWKADEATSSNIRIMQTTLERFTAKEAAREASYQNLARELQADLNKAYRDCTMNGAEHDMLHRFLIPVEKEIEVLGTDDKEAALNARLRLEEHLNTFFTYFD